MDQSNFSLIYAIFKYSVLIFNNYFKIFINFSLLYVYLHCPEVSMQG